MWAPISPEVRQDLPKRIQVEEFVINEFPDGLDLTISEATGFISEPLPMRVMSYDLPL